MEVLSKMEIKRHRYSIREYAHVRIFIVCSLFHIDASHHFPAFYPQPWLPPYQLYAFY